MRALCRRLGGSASGGGAGGAASPPTCPPISLPSPPSSKKPDPPAGPPASPAGARSCSPPPGRFPARATGAVPQFPLPASGLRLKTPGNSGSDAGGEETPPTTLPIPPQRRNHCGPLPSDPTGAEVKERGGNPWENQRRWEASDAPASAASFASPWVCFKRGRGERGAFILGLIRGGFF